MYDKTNPDNPVGDWYHVFVSYCTADIHLGDSVETYDTGDGEITINHSGQNNVDAVLELGRSVNSVRPSRCSSPAVVRARTVQPSTPPESRASVPGRRRDRARRLRRGCDSRIVRDG